MYDQVSRLWALSMARTETDLDASTMGLDVRGGAAVVQRRCARSVAHRPSVDGRTGRGRAGGGDVDGDGFDDVVVGADQWGEPAHIVEGRAYLYRGTPLGLEAVASWAADPTDSVRADFGEAVAGAGDVNGDGYDDVLVGAPSMQGAQAREEGHAYLFLGRADGLSPEAAWDLEPTDQFAARYGGSVAGVGDVNGDGYDDIAVGATGWDGEFDDEGRAYVYYGSPDGPALVEDWFADPTAVRADFGEAVAGAGDVNGDGFDDVIVGASAVGGGGPDSGAYLFLGSANGLEASPAWSANGVGYFGATLAGAGDVNGDGFDDIVVGAFVATGDTFEEGRAFLYLGSVTGLAAEPAWTAEPADRSLAAFGYALDGLGDLDGDGYDEVAVGARQWEDPDRTQEGRVYVYRGSSDGLESEPAWIADPADALARFGWSLAGVGDVNGDAAPDLVVGAPSLTVELRFEGRAYLFLGPTCVAREDGASCTDGEPCNGEEVCAAGECVAGTRLEDGVPCTNRMVCDGDETCQDGLCLPGPPLDCDDADACTVDACDSALGCTSAALDCDDADACTVDACDSALGCTSVALDCDDADACTVDGCDPALGCAGVALDCDDADACTADACDPALGCTRVALDCDDADACTADGCDPGLGCTSVALDCDDVDACTVDACDPAVGCTRAALDCDDSDACTVDTCDPVIGCTSAEVDCDDHDSCTVDACDTAVGCTVVSGLDCDDDNPCTDDGCDPATGCMAVPNTRVCDDGDSCTLGDTCDGSGECRGGPPSSDCEDAGPEAGIEGRRRGGCGCRTAGEGTGGVRALLLAAVVLVRRRRARRGCPPEGWPA